MNVILTTVQSSFSLSLSSWRMCTRRKWVLQKKRNVNARDLFGGKEITCQKNVYQKLNFVLRQIGLFPMIDAHFEADFFFFLTEVLLNLILEDYFYGKRVSENLGKELREIYSRKCCRNNTRFCYQHGFTSTSCLMLLQVSLSTYYYLPF